MASVHPGITVALYDECMDSLFALPKGQQTKVNAFIKKFRANPTAPGINYEMIEGARDPNLRSVRIDQAYRGIVLAPKQGDVYALLWVDHHDEAYAWARRRRYAVHPSTGALQVLKDPVEGEAPVPSPWSYAEKVVPLAPEPAPVTVAAPAPAPAAVPAVEPAKALFAHLDDETLAAIGVPAEIMPLVRHLYNEAALEAAQAILPSEAYEGLYYLSAGFALNDVLNDRQARPGAVDVEDFAAALAHPDSRRRFVVVEDDAALTAILDAPLERWRVFLHPSQRQLVEVAAKGAVRVLGGAGTGKTVVAMHRIAHLATKVFTQPGDRLLFTTYTKNLAADIRAHLGAILPAEALARVEVVNLDAWVFERLKAAGVHRRMAFGAEVDQLWRRVVAGAPAGMSAAFLHEEFEKVILAQGLETPQAYLTASRVGRGTLLGRRERLEAWKVFQAFREALAEKGMMPAADAMREVRRQLAESDTRPYRAVVVDESQDFSTQAFLLLRQLVPTGANDLFLVGDAHQRIYGHKVVLSRCGIEVRGRSHRLRINYRTTDEIRGWAVRLLEGQSIDDLDGGQDTAKGYKSLMHGEPPEVRMFPTVDAELDFLAERLKAWEAAGVLLRSVCVVARTTGVRDGLASGLKKRGVATYVVDKEGDRPEEAGVRLATMHRVKGLEFERVVVAQVNDGVVPLTLALGGGDAVAVAERELGERSLLYVAVTRAKREALITAGGKPSPFIGP